MLVFLLSSTALPDFCRTLFKTCSNLHPLSSKQITSCAIFNRPVHALLSLQGINAPARTLSKRARNCSAWTLSDPSRTLYECFEGSLTAAALAETVVALATYSLTSVR